MLTRVSKRVGRKGMISGYIGWFLITQSFVQAQVKEIIKLRVICLCEENSTVTGELPHKRPVAREMFLFDNVIMCTKMHVLCNYIINVLQFIPAPFYVTKRSIYNKHRKP